MATPKTASKATASKIDKKRRLAKLTADECCILLRAVAIFEDGLSPKDTEILDRARTKLVQRIDLAILRVPPRPAKKKAKPVQTVDPRQMSFLQDSPPAPPVAVREEKARAIPPPLRLPDPVNMHGACDEFGGSDYPDPYPYPSEEIRAGDCLATLSVDELEDETLVGDPSLWRRP